MGKYEIIIGSVEAGQKLLRFLERKYALPRPLLYKLLRTGQIRVNGSRCKPELVLAADDILRLPPSMGKSIKDGASCSALSPLHTCLVLQEKLGSDLQIVFQNTDLLALNKPAGLPTQGGSGISDCVALRLHGACPEGSFIPAPAHRLDKASSGLLLAGKNYAAQQHLHTLFRAGNAELEREYLCWVKGDFSHWSDNNAALRQPAPDWLCLEDMLVQRKGPDGLERMYAESKISAEAALQKVKAVGLYSACDVKKINKYGILTLVKAHLLTGKKHQIRVQLASRGFPIVGDLRYGGPVAQRLMLHASRVAIPAYDTGAGAMGKPYVFECPPDESFFI